MLAQVWSCALAGLEGRLVEVEVDTHFGLPSTTVVGLPDAAVRESKDRLYAALRNAGFSYPQHRVTVNLAPADVRKAGPAYDLPMALGMLIATGQLEVDLSDAVLIGEVALDGALRHTHGILPVAAAARLRGFKRLVVPAVNGAEAALVPGLEVVAAPNLQRLVRHFRGEERLTAPSAPCLTVTDDARYEVDLTHVRGQEHARRALEIAAAGGHNLLFSGPPGAGKTMLARCLPSILPPLGTHEALEVTAVYSVLGALPVATPLVTTRPFRSPHHTISSAGLIGGGSWPRPGEVSLAHHGVLFLDELPEFGPEVLEGLRQPLEDRRVTIARASGSATFPAGFTLVAARNPCPCGYHGDSTRDCTCSPVAITRYARRVSGPLMDRIDLHVEVPRVDLDRLVGDADGESSSRVRERVVAARFRQTTRFLDNGLQSEETGASLSPPRSAPNGRGHSAQGNASMLGPGASLGSSRVVTCNGEIPAGAVRTICQPSGEALDLLRHAMRQLGLSARAYHRILKVARTIADLEAADLVDVTHVAEGLQYRPREG